VRPGTLFPLTALALLVLGGSAYLWLERGDRSADSLGPSLVERGTGAPEDAAPKLAATEPASASRAPSEPAGPASPGVAARTTWSAQVLGREDRRALAGVTLRVTLLSPDRLIEEHVLVTDDDGRAGPIDVDHERNPGAEVRVDPGPRWSGHDTTVIFASGEANHDVIELAPPTTLSVRVVDHLAGVPLPRADVVVRDGSGVVTRGVSDVQGLVRLDWKAPGGPFTVRAAAEGFAPVFRVELARPPNADLEVELLLAPACALSVRVQDEERRTVAGCAVTAAPILGSAQAVATADGVRLALERWDSPVEEAGVHVFASVPRATMLVVRAAHPDGRRGQAFVRVPAPPGVAEATITIAGAAGTAVWTFDDRGGPLGDVAIGQEREELGATDAGGRLELALEGRARELWAHKEGHALGWQPWAPGLASVIYHLAPELLTAGTVVDASGRPQRWVRITPLLGAREEPYDARRRRGELVTSRGRKDAARTDASGAFELHGVAGGFVDLHVRPPKQGTFEVHGVPVGTRDLVITIPDESTLGIERGIALVVAVHDDATGAPVPGASVTASYAADPTQKSSNEGRTGTTATDGTVRLTSAREGHFWITAVADGYVPYSGPITEHPVGEHAVDVQLSPSADLVVALVDQAGAGVQGYWIRAVGSHGAVSFAHVQESGGWSSSSKMITDVQGRARANRMLPGRIVLAVHDGPEGEALVRREIELIAGERNEVELRLP
jgi:hypothetical protein